MDGSRKEMMWHLPGQKHNVAKIEVMEGWWTYSLGKGELGRTSVPAGKRGKAIYLIQVHGCLSCPSFILTSKKKELLRKPVRA